MIHSGKRKALSARQPESDDGSSSSSSSSSYDDNEVTAIASRGGATSSSPSSSSIDDSDSSYDSPIRTRNSTIMTNANPVSTMVSNRSKTATTTDSNIYSKGGRGVQNGRAKKRPRQTRTTSTTTTVYSVDGEDSSIGNIENISSTGSTTKTRNNSNGKTNTNINIDISSNTVGNGNMKRKRGRPRKISNTKVIPRKDEVIDICTSSSDSDAHKKNAASTDCTTRIASNAAATVNPASTNTRSQRSATLRNKTTQERKNYDESSTSSSTKDENSSYNDDDGQDSAAFATTTSTTTLDKISTTALDNGLGGITPDIGMIVDIRDPTFIWSSARIVDIIKPPEVTSKRRTVAKSKRKLAAKSATATATTTTKEQTTNSTASPTIVIVRYDGWDTSWNEKLEWTPNNPRLAKAFTYSKCYKCFVEIINSYHQKKKLKKNRNSGVVGNDKLWPCRVYIRMVDPTTATHEERKEAEDFLRTEPKVFVRPYGSSQLNDFNVYDEDSFEDDDVGSLLPRAVKFTLIHGGVWTSAVKIRKWKNPQTRIHSTVKRCHGDDGNEDSRDRSNFELAQELGMDDENVSVLPPKYFERGTLASEKYRVKCSSGFEDALTSSSSSSSSDEGVTNWEKKNLQSKSHCTTTVHSTTRSKSPVLDRTEQSSLVKLPEQVKLPQAFKITGSIYPGGNIRKGEKSDRWLASVTMGGNDVFLGSYETQTEAEVRVQAALGNSSRKKFNESTVNSSLENFMTPYDSFQNLESNDMIDGNICKQLARALDIQSIPLENIVESIQPHIPKHRLFSAHEWALERIKYEACLNEVEGNILTTTHTDPARKEGDYRKSKRKQKRPIKITKIVLKNS